ncbi:MAG: ORF6N domain-containing protein [Fibrobacterales bacterium]
MDSMLKNDVMSFEKNLKSKIYTVRGIQVMLDKDIAELYGVKPIRLREQVKRNIERFPSDFMFQIGDSELKSMVSQFAIPPVKYFGGTNPYFFTEQGVASLSGVLKSKKAIEVHLHIMRAFVALRRNKEVNTLVHHRIDCVEAKVAKHEQLFEKVFDALSLQELPKQGVFYDGQVYDAHRFSTDLIRSAKQSIIVIDNFIDDTVLTLLSKRNTDVSAKIYTKKISKQMELDLQKHNEQYPEITIRQFSQSHDRFLIIDKDGVYHIGASLKDLGKSWFAFSRIEMDVKDILDKLPYSS